MAKKLDRKRDFGEIMGHEGGAAFIQDEVLFDVDGNELVTEKPAPAAKKAAAPAAAKKAAEPAVADQVAANLEGANGDFTA